MTNIKRNLVALKPKEKIIWDEAYRAFKGQGLTDASSDVAAWHKCQLMFLRLRKYGGCIREPEAPH